MKRGGLFLLAFVLLVVFPLNIVLADEMNDAIILAETEEETESSGEAETEKNVSISDASILELTETDTVELETEQSETDEVILSIEDTEMDSPAVVSTIRASGTCGKNLTWELSDDGVMTIRGTGEMTEWDPEYNYSKADVEVNVPWFEYRTKIISIRIEDGVSSIGQWSFYQCNNITSVTIPESVTSIGYSAFRNCTSLASITIPSSVTSILACVFEDCVSLTSITLSSGITSIGYGAFRGCTSLMSAVIPSSVTLIDSFAFENCESLTSITFSSGITSIYYGTFYGCTSLASVVIPSGVTSIGVNTFGACTSLTSVVIPSSVISIAKEAFEDCFDLEDVYYKGSEEEWSEVSIGNNNTYLTKATIHYTYKVKFNANGGSVSKTSKSVMNGLTYGSLPTPTRSGYKFNGWYTKASGGTKVTKNTIVSKTKNHKLYAHWTQLNTQTITATSSYTKTYKSSGTFTLDAAAVGTLTYKSSDTSVVTVSSAGVVMMKGYGTATITVEAAATGNYDSATKTVTVKIKPARMTITNLSMVSSQAIMIQWKADSKATGYQMQISTTKKFSSSVTASITTDESSKQKITIKKLVSGTKYYVRIRAYKTTDSNTIYGKWSEAMNITLK